MNEEAPSAPAAEQLIIVRPGVAGNGVRGFMAEECEQVRPLFGTRREAVDWALGRTASGQRGVEVRDADGTILRKISGPEAYALCQELNADRGQDIEGHNSMAGDGLTRSGAEDIKQEAVKPKTDG